MPVVEGMEGCVCRYLSCAVPAVSHRPADLLRSIKELKLVLNEVRGALTAPCP